MANYTVLLTGGIASGKSTVEALFQAQNINCIDTDKIARNLTNPIYAEAQLVLTEIFHYFGAEVFSDRKAFILDRRKLRTIIFNNLQAKLALEAIIHPRIFQKSQQELGLANSDYVILSVPLFHQASIYRSIIQRVLCVDIPVALQIQRLMCRDNIDKFAAQKIIAAQPSNTERLELADDIIDNQQAPNALKQQVLDLHHKYLQLAQDYKSKIH